MNEGNRPGGLTALAAINFVLAGFSLLGIVGMMAFFAMKDKVVTDQMTEAQKAQIGALQDMGTGLLVLLIALNLLSGILLLTSGIGYLRQKKLLGRLVGQVYAILTIVASIVSGVMFAPELGGGFHIGTL